MNYFDHHIGDYDEATSHLSAREDGIYHRLIRKYYAKETPLPADIAKLQRWVRCRDEEDRQAVVDVLDEFFVLRDDGYHQKTCDEVIQAYKEGEPERVIKKANESTRTTRHRLERSRLFQVLVAAGQHAQWNTGIVELRALVAKIQAENPAVTALVPAPATAPVTTSNVTAMAPATLVTATQYPVPSTHTPIEKKAVPAGSPKPPASARKISLPEWMELIKTKGEKPILKTDPVFEYATKVGIPNEFLHLAWQEFKRTYSKPGVKKYIDWRQVFRNAVEKNWLKLWWLDGETYSLTTVGQQAKRLHDDQQQNAA